MAPTIPGFQFIKLWVQYLASHPNKSIFYPSNYYDGSNIIRLTWSGNEVEDHTTHNFLECHKYSDHDRIINRRQSVSDIIHTLIGVVILWKVQIKPALSSNSTGE